MNANISTMEGDSVHVSEGHHSLLTQQRGSCGSDGEPGEWLTGPVGADPACTTTMGGQQGVMAREDDGSWKRGREGDSDSELEKEM